MPRACWLAVGGAAAALGGPFLAPLGPLAVLLAAVALFASGLGLGLRVRRSERPGRALRGAACSLGAAAVAARLLVALLLAPAVPPAALPEGMTVWQAEVISIGSTAGGQQRAVVEAKNGEGRWRVYAWLPRYPGVAPTDQLRFVAALEPAQASGDFGEFLQRSGAVATVRVRDMERLPQAGWLAGLEQVRRAAGEALVRAMPQPQAGLAAGILVGLRDMVDPDLAADFATAGLSHVVAISGWNIALVGAVVGAMLRARPKRQRAAVILVAIVAYTLLAGASPSVLRAAAMGAICLLARESGRRGAAATALGLAAWIMLVVEPRIVEDVGFRLSVAATAGLLAWSSPLTRALQARVPDRVPGWIVESLGVSLAAQAATLPLVLLHFGRLSLISPIANLVLAPVVAPAMLASLLGLVAGVAVAFGLPGMLMAPLVLTASLVLGAMVAIGRVAAAVPLASLDLPEPAGLGAALLSVACLAIGASHGARATLYRRAAAIARSRLPPQPVPIPPIAHGQIASGTAASGMARIEPAPRLRLAALGAGVALLVVAAALGASQPDGRFRMTVLDVGQGDAILLEGARGGRVLVDGGPDPDLLLARLDERIPAHDRRIDLVILTHPHEDHVAGLAPLLERYFVEVVADPGMLGPGPGDAEFRRVLARGGARTVTLTAPATLALDGAHVAVLWPRRGEVPLEAPDTGTGINNVSVVLDVRVGERRLLLTGDAEEEVDPELLLKGLAEGGPVDVLKVAHHGSRTASTEPFLAAVAPRVALISAGRDNPYGHPAPQTITRLESVGARVLRTDLDGNIEVSTDGRDLVVSSSGGRVAMMAPAPFRGVAISALLCALPAPEESRMAALGQPRRARGAPVPRQAAARPPLVHQTSVGQPESAWPALPCYDRTDGRSVTRSGSCGPDGPSSAGRPRAPLGRRGRDRGVPGAANSGPRRQRGPPPRGDRGPPPRS